MYTTQHPNPLRSRHASAVPTLIPLGGGGYPAGVTGGKRLVWTVFRLSFLRALYGGWVRAWYRAQAGVVVRYDPRITVTVALRLVSWHIRLDARRCLERVLTVQRDGTVVSGRSPERLRQDFRDQWVAAGWAREVGPHFEVLLSMSHPVPVGVALPDEV